MDHFGQAVNDQLIDFGHFGHDARNCALFSRFEQDADPATVRRARPRGFESSRASPRSRHVAETQERVDRDDLALLHERALGVAARVALRERERTRGRRAQGGLRGVEQ
ncbi:MAG: hypothetical protein M3Y87_16360, partial [Myxococcota bacterium]|nr:hypothetical protein [Myxococcota bacterium]